MTPIDKPGPIDPRYAVTECLTCHARAPGTLPPCDCERTDWRARAIAAEAALARAVADADAQIVAVARESEARGRLHGLLAAAMAVRTEHKQNLIELNTGGSHLRHYWFGTLDEDDTLLNVFAALASEATDGPA